MAVGMTADGIVIRNHSPAGSRSVDVTGARNGRRGMPWMLLWLTVIPLRGFIANRTAFDGVNWAEIEHHARQSNPNRRYPFTVQSLGILARSKTAKRPTASSWLQGRLVDLQH